MTKAELQQRLYLLQCDLSTVENKIWRLQMKRDDLVSEKQDLLGQLQRLNCDTPGMSPLEAKIVNDMLMKEVGDIT